MSDARPKASGPPMCKICNHAHWMREPHQFNSQAKSTTGNGATERARQESSPTARRESKVGAAGGADAPAPKPRRAGAGRTKRASPSRLELASAALADAETRTAQPKSKRKSMVAKDGTNRGRPKGKVPFDKKEHDKLKARERRAAKKAAAVKP